MAQATDFINWIFGDAKVVVSKQFTGRDGQMGFADCFSDDDEFTAWDRRSSRIDQAWYFCIASVTGETKENGRPRRGRAQLEKVYALVLDDVGTKAETPPLEPSWKLETSEGNCQWGYLLVPTDDLETFERVVKACAARGWTDGGAGGAYRLMRLPGSTNTKEGRGMWKARLTYQDDVDWTLDELVEGLGLDLSEIPQQTPTLRQSGSGVAATVDDDVLTWMSDAGWVVKDDGGQWMQVKCPNADAHTSGAGTADYSPLGRGEGDWAMTRAFKCHHEHCRELTTARFLGVVKDRGGPTRSGYDPLPFFQQRFVFVQNGSLMCDLERRRAGEGMASLTSLNDWSNANRLMVPRGDNSVLLKTAMLDDRATQKAYDVCVTPTLEDDMWASGDGRLNLYVPPTWAETDETPDMFLRHVEWILPDDGGLFLDWLAFKVQYPAKRPYSLLMVTDAAQGIGRSLVARMLAKMMPRGVGNATLAHLLGRAPSKDATYNVWATSETQFLVVEEAKQDMDASMFYRGYEAFKDLVDPSPVKTTINRKFGSMREETLYFALLMFSNHLDALAVPAEDRRVCVLRNRDEKRDADEYEALWDEWRNPAGREHERLYWYLRRRQITHDMTYAPMTEAKRHMIGSVKSSADEFMEDLREDYVGEFEDKSWITRAVLEANYRQWCVANGAEYNSRAAEMLWRKLPDAYECENHSGARVRVGNTRIRIKRV